MPSEPIPPATPLVDHLDRLAILDAYNVLDTPPEAGFDDLVQLAALACAAPVALLSLVDRDRQWFKARVNFPPCETDLNSSVCKFALGEPDLLVVPDLTADPRTAANPLVTGEPFIRFYAGAPLRTPEGHVIGSLCIIDQVPRPDGLSAVQAEHLRRCARQVMGLLELRRGVEARDALLARQDAELRRERHLAILAEASAALLTASDPGRVIEPILATGAASLGFEQCFIYEIAEDGPYLYLTQSIGATDAVRSALLRVGFDGPLCGIVAETGQPLVLADVLASVETRYALARQNGIDAFAGYPILSRGRVVGVISFTTGAQTAFDEGALSFFSTIARYFSAVRERLDGEEALRASETRFRALVTAGAQSVYRMSPDWQEMRVLSDAGVLTDTETPSVRWLDYYTDPADRPGVLAAIEDAIRRKDTFEFEHRVRRADGTLGWTLSCAVPILDHRGEVVEWFGTATDVTDRRSAQEAVVASEAHWRGLFERLSEGFIVGEVIRNDAGAIRDWRYIDVNAAWGDLVSINPATAVGRTIREVFPGIEDAWVTEFADVVETGQPTSFVRQVGTLARWYEGRAFSLGRERFGVIFLEVTERVQADARRNGLLEFGERLREGIDAKAIVLAGSRIIGRVLGVGRVGYGTVGPDGESFVVEEDWTAPGFPTLAGRYRMDDYGLYAEDLRQGRTVVIPDVREDERTVATAANLEAVAARTLINLPIVEKDRTVAVLYVNDDHPRAWSGPEVAFVRQIAQLIRQAVERRHAEDRQDLLNHELSHRLKNTMAMVVSIAHQTLRSVPERDPIEAFQKRIQALASAHDLLLRKNWTAADLRTVCADVLRNAAERGCINLEGPDVALGPSAALSTSLILHEMATNCQKYGSLSADAGRVEVRWWTEGGADGPDLVLRWQESGGPKVTAPARRGFGSRLIRTGLVGTGGVDLAYHTDGLVAVLRAPMIEVQRS